MGSVFCGLMVIGVRLYVALGSSVIGMTVCSAERVKRFNKVNKVKVSSCHWDF